ncbi:CO dehydrogenase/acetyl-CoA synthase complex subunit epsilon [Candidatus Bathyarchaeota archaeon]|nr:MAG: CO dehydrogenase/acetyl-CoA synthase complex subunit epsilon [Candidatus Bathyarchaeota archaeon]
MSVAEPWQTAEIPGPKKAIVMAKPEIVVAMVKRAKRPIMIVGHKAAEIDLGEEKLIDYLIRFAKRTDIPVVATAHIIGEFLKRGFKPAAYMPAVNIGSRLADPQWEGLDGKGQYDLAVFVGMQYYFEWLILSGLKHYAPYLKTLTLDNVYQPHASLSFPNLSMEKWKENLKVIMEKLEGGE